jgi:hypothetical protein
MSKRKRKAEQEVPRGDKAKAAKRDEDPVGEGKAAAAAAPAPAPALERKWKRVLANVCPVSGTAGDFQLTLSWQLGVGRLREAIHAHAAFIDAELARIEPSHRINVVAKEGICGLGTITILCAPDTKTVTEQLGGVLSIHRMAVVKLLTKHAERYEETNIPLGTARSDPGGVWIVTDPDFSAVVRQAALQSAAHVGYLP